MRRKIWTRIKLFFCVLCAALCAVVAMLLWNAPAFAQGEGYTLYLGANSSSLAVRSQHAVWDKLTAERVAGESTCYVGNRYEELKQRFCAELLFEERVGDIVNYYLYSARLGDPVFINGYAVNLHVAVNEERTAVGTPLIFGGF